MFFSLRLVILKYFVANEDEYGIKKKDINKKKESKWDKKEKGYTIFDAENSDEELVNAEK